MEMSIGKRPRLDLEAIVPIAAPQALEAIAAERQVAGLPLPEHVAVLVQHEPGILEELPSRAAQINAPAPGGGDGARMQARVKRVLDDLHLRQRLAEDALERAAERLRKRY